MSKQATQPKICLNMIVRNEAHIVRETLDSVAPYIDSWVIVDTGSDDGTQELIRSHMANLGIPGALYEHPWINFGHNRSEAMKLAQGKGDYIWVIDADDLVNGEIDFSELSADVYSLHYRSSVDYWRKQLFRSGLPWRYAGVVHEYPMCDVPFVAERLVGDYSIESRRLGSRNLDTQKYARDCEMLLLDLERNPHDARTVFYLARSYFDLGDYDSAREWYARRIEMGGFAEEVYYSMLQVAQAMIHSDLPWPDIQDAYLRAWEFRPTRAEALVAIARRYRTEGEYQLGHLFAEYAARIPLPEADVLFVDSSSYLWRAEDEQAICASWLGKHEESMALCRKLIAQPETPEVQRQRIAKNRDFSVPAMLESSASYSNERVRQLLNFPGDVTVSLIASPDRRVTEQALNSFLASCADLTRVGRFLVVTRGMSRADHCALTDLYPFLHLIDQVPEDTHGGDVGDWVSTEVVGRFWLNLGQGWRFFTSDCYLTRLTSVFEAEPTVLQVGINVNDAASLTGFCASEDTVRRAPGTGRYVVNHSIISGPAMIEMDRLSNSGAADVDPIERLRERIAEGGGHTATLDEVLCIAEA